jgi:tape measure domain-containing protein
MANSDIKITLKTALDAAGIEATKSQMNTMTKSVSDSMSKLATDNRHHWADIKAAWDMALGGIQKIAGFISGPLKKAFDAEYALTNFKTLLGSIEDAKKHVADLKAFASQTPLTFGDLSSASKTLLAFGVNVDKVMPSLKTLGDISLGNAEKMQNLAYAFGKVASNGKMSAVELKQMVVAGFNPLQEIADRTGESMESLRDKMEKGGITFDLVEMAMKSATSEGGRFNDAMKDASQTGNGLFSTMQDNWNMAVSKFGSVFMEAAKGGMTQVIEVLQKLHADGSLEKWANVGAAALEKVVSLMRKLIDIGKIVGDFFSVMRESWEEAGTAAGTLIAGVKNRMADGMPFFQALKEARKEAKDALTVEQVHHETQRWANQNLKKIDDSAWDQWMKEEKELRKEEELAKSRAANGVQRDPEIAERMKQELAKKSEAEEKKERAKAEKEEKARRKKAAADLEKHNREAAAKAKKERQKEAKEIIQIEEDVLKKQKRNTQERIKLLTKEIAEIQKRREATERGMGVDASRNQWGAYQYHFDKEGKISFSEWQRANRYGDETSDQAKARRRSEIEDRRMEKLKEQVEKGKKISDRDQKKLDDWEKFKEERDGVEKRQKQIEKLREDAEKAAIEGEKHLKDIRKKMDKYIEAGVLN